MKQKEKEMEKRYQIKIEQISLKLEEEKEANRIIQRELFDKNLELVTQSRNIKNVHSSDQYS